MEEFIQQLEFARRLGERMSSESILYYLQNVVINSSPHPLPFGTAAESWQRELLAPKIPALEYLAGKNPSYWIPDGVQRRGYNGPLSFMSVLARGHDKSSLEGRILSYLLCYSDRPIHAYVLAADRDQGKLILQAMKDEAELNPWLYDQLEFKNNVVTGRAGFVEVLPADAGSAYGLRGNLYLCDEITNWPDRGKKMWTAVLSGREKVPGSLLIVLSNAGVEDSWQHEIRRSVERDPDWVLFERQGQLASWMSRERVDALRRLLPPSEGDRLFDNRWVDPASEFDFLRRREITGCEELGRSLGLLLRMWREPDVDNYVASIDYGPRRDRTALCVVHTTAERRCVVDRLDVWQGNPDDAVQVPAVEAWIKMVKKAYRPKLFVADPAGLEGTMQWMERENYNLERFACRAGAGNYELAQHLRSIVVNKQLVWYPTAGQLVTPAGIETFADELRTLRVKKMPYGFRFDHERQKHDDRAVAVTMAALRAFDFPPSSGYVEATPLHLRDIIRETGYNFDLQSPIHR